MQGTLNEIDIRSILQLIELGQRTGELFVEAYPSLTEIRGRSAVTPFQGAWFVFFVNGQIVYTTPRSSNHLGRLQDYLKHYKINASFDSLLNSSLSETSAPEYAYLWRLLEKKILSPVQGRNILSSMIEETLFDLLSLSQGEFIFKMGSALAPQLTAVEIAPAISKIMIQVQQWKEFYPHIQSPQQGLAIADAEKLQATLPESAYRSLEHWADSKTSLRQLARYLDRDLLTLVKGLYPYIERGWLHTVEIQPFLETLDNSEQPIPPTPHIVCLDDDLSIGKKVESILSLQGYQVTVLSDPLHALSQIFSLNPNLILCDISMPQLDGYELCAMWRHSQAFRQTPIIMLTSKEAFLDRVQARMVGATDYLTKPFGENELLLLLEKYLSY